jgi:hypothetical protein
MEHETLRAALDEFDRRTNRWTCGCESCREIAEDRKLQVAPVADCIGGCGRIHTGAHGQPWECGECYDARMRRCDNHGAPPAPGTYSNQKIADDILAAFVASAESAVCGEYGIHGAPLSRCTLDAGHAGNHGWKHPERALPPESVDHSATHRPNPYLWRAATICEDCGLAPHSMRAKPCEMPGTGAARAAIEEDAHKLMLLRIPGPKAPRPEPYHSPHAGNLVCGPVFGSYGRSVK